VAAGFVRDAVWDYDKPMPLTDINVLFYLNAPDHEYNEQAFRVELHAVLPRHSRRSVTRHACIM